MLFFGAEPESLNKNILDCSTVTTTGKRNFYYFSCPISACGVMHGSAKFYIYRYVYIMQAHNITNY